jgi:hypothetical protein
MVPCRPTLLLFSRASASRVSSDRVTVVVPVTRNPQLRLLSIVKVEPSYEMS